LLIDEQIQRSLQHISLPITGYELDAGGIQTTTTIENDGIGLIEKLGVKGWSLKKVVESVHAAVVQLFN
jgi:hypothetical protein